MCIRDRLWRIVYSMSLMKKPLGDGTALVTKFEDYRKYKFTKKYWIEDMPLVIFPDCKRDIHITEDEK